MQILKTGLNTIWGGVVTWINASITMHSLNEGIAVLVGIIKRLAISNNINVKALPTHNPNPHH